MVLYGLTVIVLNSTGLEHGRQPADPHVPRPGGAVLGGRRRLRRPDRPADRARRHQPPARRRVHRPVPGRRRTSPLILLLNSLISTVTVFFAPAEAAMIPLVVERRQLLDGERHLHADAQRGLRDRLRAPRPARGQHRLAGGGHPRRRRRCTSSPRPSASRCRRRRPPRREPAARLGVGEAERAVEVDVRAAARGPGVHPRRTGRSPGR